MGNKSILILGKPDSGKTTFITQFYSRLVKGKSAITLYKSVENITPIIDARERLSNGEETQPTSTEKYEEIILPLELDGIRVDLKYPDFAGEQVSKIFEERDINKSWNNSILASNDWLFFIRLTGILPINDLSSQTYDKEQYDSKPKANVELEITDQTFFIELLQILLQIKGFNYHLKTSSINLTIVLTCWDELNTTEHPQELLKISLPLLFEFIKSNWHEDNFRVYGLSAQGFKLGDQEAKDKYLDDGPENFGYLITPSNSKERDITLLISEIL